MTERSNFWFVWSLTTKDAHVTFSKSRQSIGYKHHLVAYCGFGEQTDNGAIEVEKSSCQHDYTWHQENGGGPHGVHLLEVILKKVSFFD